MTADDRDEEEKDSTRNGTKRHETVYNGLLRYERHNIKRYEHAMRKSDDGRKRIREDGHAIS
jgi:hypothetical protein